MPFINDSRLIEESNSQGGVMKKLLVFLAVTIFALTSTLGLAAGKSWFLIKDKNGVCKVIEAEKKTPKTIAGPFTSKDAAAKAKDKKCPAAPAKKAAAKKKAAPKKKADPKKTKK
jgi:hypothetical protein